MGKASGYTVDTVINLHLSIGLGTDRKEKMKLGELLSMDQEELDGASKAAVYQMIHDALKEWSLTYIDTGWSADGDEPWAGA